MKKYLKSKIDSLTEDQKELYNDMLSNNLLQICIPTGAGKGYLMMVDLLNQIVSTRNKINVIATHRLMLNTQHLNDIFDVLSPMIGKIGYIFVGSSKYDVNKFQENTTFNKALLDANLSYNEIVSSTTNSLEVKQLVKNHIDAGRKVVIMTTYHSLHTLKEIIIDTIYCDEAQTLASDQISKFQENFESISYKRCFFFTATPKDCNEDTELFLMNNEEVFGERVGLDFRYCVEQGYLTRPIVHIATPENYNSEYDYKSIDNMSKFIIDSYNAHRDFIKTSSSLPDLIEPKILVKCASVDDMWKLQSNLLGKMEGVKICAGASRNDYSNECHFIDNVGIKDRSDYLEQLQLLGSDEKAIVLHYDTMSEGINVSGFTGVMFLGGKLPTITKTLQNTGRATRLHPFDRERFKKGEISVGDGNWVKAYCAVIIPFYDRESEFTSKELAKQIKSLRDNFEYDPVFYVSIGSDISKGEKPEEIEALNDKDERKKKFAVIETIQHDIEVLEQQEFDLKEKERLEKMTDLEFFEEIRK